MVSSIDLSRSAIEGLGQIANNKGRYHSAMLVLSFCNEDGWRKPVKKSIGKIIGVVATGIGLNAAVLAIPGMPKLFHWDSEKPQGKRSRAIRLVNRHHILQPQICTEVA